ncbi:MAG: YgiQ family radical SAM protein, partial [Candidatus Woesearchaeota archaeon]
MRYDVILVLGETFFDHPLCGTAVLKRLLERAGFSVGLIESPRESDIAKFGEPALFFGVSSGSIDSMLKNYTPLKKPRNEKNDVPDRAVIVYCNWIRKRFRDSRIVLGGTEATLRRFSHYDYWDNKLRKPIILDSRADILVFGSSEKQIVEIAHRLRAKESLLAIPGTCIVSKQLPEGFVELPSHEEVEDSKERFCDMQTLLSNRKNLAQKIGNRYVLQYRSPKYSTADLDDYYGLAFTRVVPQELRGFEFSVVTHRGCIGNCNFCSLRLTQGDRVISRSEDSILKEIESMTRLKYFKGNVDDFGGPSANMYGMDCRLAYECDKDCIGCPKLDRSNKRLICLLRKARVIKGIKNVYLRSGVRFDLASPEYTKEIACHHVYDTLRIAPEHV